MVDEVTQVFLGDAVAIRAGVLLRCARQGWRKRGRALQEADVIHHHVPHVADSSLGSEHHLEIVLTAHKWNPACYPCEKCIYNLLLLCEKLSEPDEADIRLSKRRSGRRVGGGRPSLQSECPSFQSMENVVVQFSTLTGSNFYAVFLVDVCVIYTPESCLTAPETLLPASTCCPGYQSATKPRKSRFHFSVAPKRLGRKTDLHSVKTFAELVCVCVHVCVIVAPAAFQP